MELVGLGGGLLRRGRGRERGRMELVGLGGGLLRCTVGLRGWTISILLTRVVQYGDVVEWVHTLQGGSESALGVHRHRPYLIGFKTERKL